MGDYQNNLSSRPLKSISSTSNDDENNSGKSNTIDLAKDEQDEATLTFISAIDPKVESEKRDLKDPQVTVAFKRQRGWKKYLGLLLTVAAAIQFSLSALIIKVLNYHPFNLGVWRFLVMMLIPIPFLSHAIFWKKQPVFNAIWPLTSTTLYLGIQAIVGSNALVLLFYGLQRLNVADTLVISTSAPVFVTLLAYVFLGEKCGVFPIFTAVLSLCGVGIICRPPLLTGEANMDESLMIGTILSFGSMMCIATCYVIIRYLRTVHHALVNFCFSIWGFAESSLIAFSIGVLAFPATLIEVMLIITTAFLAFFAQTCITLALKYEQAGPVALVRTTELIFAFLWQLLFLGVEPDLYSLFGALLVVSAVVLTALRKMIGNLSEDHKYRRIFWILLI